MTWQSVMVTGLIWVAGSLALGCEGDPSPEIDRDSGATSPGDAENDNDSEADSDSAGGEGDGFYGSCRDASIEPGICWEYIGPTYADSEAMTAPTSVCGLVSGTFSADARCPGANSVGVCRQNDGTGMDLNEVYYAPEHDANSAQARCGGLGSVWLDN